MMQDKGQYNVYFTYTTFFEFMKEDLLSTIKNWCIEYSKIRRPLRTK